MSERGSFVTEYIYCPKCLEAAKKVLLREEKYFCSCQVPSWKEGEFLPIIAGKIGSVFKDSEFQDLDILANALCHPLRIGVIFEYGANMITVIPKKNE